MEELIHSTIHNLTIDNPIYNMLYGGDGKVLDNHIFYFNFRYRDNEEDVVEDIKFLLDNIIAKIFEINYNIDYQTTHRSQLGNYIHYDDMKILNPFIVEEYFLKEELKIAELEMYLTDLELFEKDDSYVIKWEIPILELDKTKIEKVGI